MIKRKYNYFFHLKLTGQKEIMVLTGPAVIKRIERDRAGISVQFLKELKTLKVMR